MSTIIIFIIIFLILIVLGYFKRKEILVFQNKLEEIPVYGKMLLTKDELNLYQNLKLILPDDTDISCKCRLEDIIGIDRKCKNYNQNRNRIKSNHIDFVIFNAITGKIEFVIELDGNSHNLPGQKESDIKKDIFLKNAKIKLIRIKAQEKYNPEMIKKYIEDSLNK